MLADLYGFEGVLDRVCLGFFDVDRFAVGGELGDVVEVGAGWGCDPEAVEVGEVVESERF